MNCFSTRLSFREGYLRAEEHEYLGLWAVTIVNGAALLAMAVGLRDRLFFWPKGQSGVIVVDYYPVGWSERDIDYSILVQGESLEGRLLCCFATVSR